MSWKLKIKSKFKRYLFIVSFFFTSITLSTALGYTVTYLLAVKYFSPGSISAQNVRSMELLWSSSVMLTDILLEVQKRLKQNNNILTEAEKKWLENTVRVSVLKVQRNITEEMEKNTDEQIKKLLSELINICDQLNSFLVFPSDTTIFLSVAKQFCQFFENLNQYTTDKKLNRIFPTQNTTSKINLLINELTSQVT